MTRRLGLVGVGLLAIVLVAIAARRDFHGFTLVVRAANLQGVARQVADFDTVRIQERLGDITAARWLATSGLAPTRRIGLMGISFSGGLAVVAAGRESLRNHLLYVFSFGGHDDLRRVLEYFCTGSEAAMMAKAPPAPHDYGVAIVLLNVADHLVPPAQVEPLRAAVRRFLWASYLDRIDKPRAQIEFAALREAARRLPEPTAMLLRYVNDRDVAHLG